MRLLRGLLFIALISAVAAPASALDWDDRLQDDRTLLGWRSDRELLRSLAGSPPSPAAFELFGRMELAGGSSDRFEAERADWKSWRGWLPFAASLSAWILVETLTDSPKTARWSHINSFDESARESLIANTRSGRETADSVSNGMLYGTIVLWAVERVYAGVQEAQRDRERDPTLSSWQAAGIAGGSLLDGIRTDGTWLLLSGIATSGTKAASGRARPKTTDCLELDDGSSCGGRSGNSSFWSGHTSLSGTMAGLTCTHRMERIDRNALDVGICVLSSAMAVTTGAMRVVGDEHWTTDVIAGSVVGTLFGWALPSAFRDAQRGEAAHPAPSLRLQPMVSPDRYGLSLSVRY